MKARRTIAVRRLVLLLIAGAMVNVAVAWGCLLLLRHGSIEEVSSQREAQTLLRAFDPHFVLVLFQGRAHIDRRFGWRRVGLEWTYLDGLSPIIRDMVYATFAGWPFHSVCGHCRFNRDSRRFEYVGALTVPSAFRRDNVRSMMYHDLPYQPLWPGFAINTVFYAAILWLLVAAPFAIRKRRRIKRGLCPACAYPVGSNELCTECGARVKGVST